MSLWDKFVGEFVDVIEWTDDSSDTMVYRFERYGNEIKYNAMLTVREGQVAVFVNEGQVADVFEPGMYRLKTNNLPVLSTLQGWPHGFESPFKAEVYYFNTKRFVDLKWGTKNPLMLRDKEFGAVRLRAFGTYAVRIKEPVTFLREIVGTDGHFKTDDITNQLRNLIVSRFASIIGESNIPVLDLAANYDDLGEFITTRIGPEFLEYGLEITKLLVENISLPKTVEEALDRRTSMGVVGNLHDYMAFQSAEAVQAAAQNPSGGASDGIGLGVGFAMANKMSETFAGSGKGPAASQPPGPPPIPAAPSYFVALNGEQAGPFEPAEIRRLAERGELSANTLVWVQGMADWTAAGEVADLAVLFKSIPPPIPKG